MDFQLDPRTKLAWCLSLIFMALFSGKLFLELGIIFFVILIQLGFQLSFTKFKLLIPALILVASQMLILQILFQREGTVVFEWGALTVYSGALNAALIGLARTSAITMAAVQFMSWTSSTDLALMFVSFRIPYRYAMLPVIASRFMPLMAKEYQSIRESQAVRGLPTQNGLKSLGGMFATLMPLLYRALRHASDLALSMELRGYGQSSERTFERTLSLKTWDYAGLGIMIIAILAVSLFIAPTL